MKQVKVNSEGMNSNGYRDKVLRPHKGIQAYK